jgi:hypothetical protein
MTTATADRFGKRNAAYAFNGQSSKVHLGNWFKPPSFSVSLWINAGSQRGHAVLIDNNHGGNSNWVCQSLDEHKNNGYGFGGISLFYVPAGKWVHLVLVSDLDTQRVFVDSLLKGTGKFAIRYNLEPNLNLGYWADQNARYWTGSIDDVRLYDRALSATEVSALHRLEKTDR